MEKNHPSAPPDWANITDPACDQALLLGAPLSGTGRSQEEDLAKAFTQRFGRTARLVRAPGRVNLIGEHTDYNQGLVMPFNTSLHTWIAYAPHTGRVLHVHACPFNESVSLSLDRSNVEPTEPAWAAYLGGVVTELREQGVALTGADLMIDGNIPLGGGLSSSASLAVALGLALLDSSDSQMPAEQLAAICQRAEHRAVGVPCGIMDPFSIANGRQGYAMQLDCRDLSIAWIPIPEGLELTVIDSGVKHALRDGAYAARRAECESAVQVLRQLGLNCQSLRDVSLEQLLAHRAALTTPQFQRARHVVTENQRVVDAGKALSDGEAGRVGALVNASHASLRDDFDVSCTEVDELVGIAQSTDGVLGARMFGGGFGGCVLVLSDADHGPTAVESIVDDYARYSGQKPYFHTARPSAAAGLVNR